MGGHLGNSADLDEEARRLTALPPVQFASFMLTMLFTKILHPKGVLDMTVIVDGSVMHIGQSHTLDALTQAKTALAGEIAKVRKS